MYIREHKYIPTNKKKTSYDYYAFYYYLKTDLKNDNNRNNKRKGNKIAENMPFLHSAAILKGVSSIAMAFGKTKDSISFPFPLECGATAITTTTYSCS